MNGDSRRNRVWRRLLEGTASFAGRRERLRLMDVATAFSPSALTAGAGVIDIFQTHGKDRISEGCYSMLARREFVVDGIDENRGRAVL